MSKHLFGMVVTHKGIYANNRGENEGNTTTLQKVIHDGDLFTTVSAEAIRYALREGWQTKEGTDISLNRRIIDHKRSEFTDPDFKKWHQNLDDDVLGFMHAKKETISRRGILEVTRAISLTPWRGDVMHNFASPGSNPIEKGKDPIPYSVEVHDTRYQFGFAMTVNWLGKENLCSGGKDHLSAKEKASRMREVIDGIVNLRRVGGNHARYMTDYSPETIIMRWTDDPAPRFLYCFREDELGHISLSKFLDRVRGEDICAKEVVIGTACEIPELSDLKKEGVTVTKGVKEAVNCIMSSVKKYLQSS